MDAAEPARTLPPEFFLLHHGLRREAPGSDAATRDAIRRLPPLPPWPRVLDLGCGPGAQTLVLAQTLNARVVAIDLHRPFLDELERHAHATEQGHLIETRCADFAQLEEPPETADLVWSEGAIYLLGFGEGLRRWRPLLKPGACMAVTDAVWLVPDPPDEARSRWWSMYPGMASIEANVHTAEQEGMRVLDTFTLPPTCWWSYYRPLRRRLERLRPQARRNPVLAEVIAEEEHEIDLFARFGDTFGYQFFIMQRRDAS